MTWITRPRTTRSSPPASVRTGTNSNPWYGGSYKNNKGHYDLVSAGGIDFIMVYMGWGIGDEEIEWMNDVLARYPDRVAILNFHEYLLASGGLGTDPQEVYQRVVAPNENVKMVLSGHYHSAQKTVSQVRHGCDGVADRNVVNMLFDYQGMEEGGKGYLRLMHVNTADGTMSVRTYSPSLKRIRLRIRGPLPNSRPRTRNLSSI